MVFIATLLVLASLIYAAKLYTQDKKHPYRKLKITLTVLLLVIGYLTGISQQPISKQTPVKEVVKTIVDDSKQKQAESYESKNSSLAAKISSQESALNQQENTLTQLTNGQTSQTTTTASINPTPDLGNLTFQGEYVVTVNQNDPGFTSNDLDTSHGPWQHYGNLDTLNRVTTADALLNQSLMPTQPRERLYINPTGWHNKRLASGWLYNRSHLIGFQLTGQNNNIKNLMTGTRQLNDPGMVDYENYIAQYLKQSPNNYVRYSVRPIFVGNELVARGVQLRAQSVNSSAIEFNVYIFNVQPGVTINYNDGTSQIN